MNNEYLENYCENFFGKLWFIASVKHKRKLQFLKNLSIEVQYFDIIDFLIDFLVLP